MNGTNKCVTDVGKDQHGRCWRERESSEKPVAKAKPKQTVSSMPPLSTVPVPYHESPSQHVCASFPSNRSPTSESPVSLISKQLANYLLRAVPKHATEENASEHDGSIRRCLGRLLESYIPDPSWEVAKLLLSIGGFGLRKGSRTVQPLNGPVG